MTTIPLEERGSQLKQLISFIGNPYQEVSSDIGTGEKIKKVIVLSLLKMLITVTLMMFINTFLGFKNEVASKAVDIYSPQKVLFLGAFLVPLTEEAMFRLSIFFKPLYLTFSMGLYILMEYSSTVHDVGMLNTEVAVLERGAIFLSAGTAIFFIATKFRLQLETFWTSRFRWIYYASAVIFGFAHFGNYDITTSDFYLVPLIVLPHIIAGLIFGYVRIKYGFKYGVLIHMINNLIVFSAALAF